jgi:hypothetical protein
MLEFSAYCIDRASRNDSDCATLIVEGRTESDAER